MRQLLLAVLLLGSPVPPALCKETFPAHNADLWGPDTVLSFLRKNALPQHALKKIQSRINVESYNEVDGPALKAMNATQMQKQMGLKQDQAAQLRSAVDGLPDGSSIGSMIAEAASKDWPDDIIDRINATLWGVFIGDALGMPVHWYYDIRQLKQDHGQVKGYVAPLDKHPGNWIMSGHWEQNKCHIRQLQKPLHLNKKDLSAAQRHYHVGKKAGENTLDPLLKVLLMESLVSNGTPRYDYKDYTDRYVRYMTTPKTHNDTYLNIPHRQFLWKYLFKKCNKDDPMTCTGEENHSTASVNGFVHVPAILALALALGTEAAMKSALEHVRLFFQSQRMAAAARVFGELIFALWKGQDFAKTMDEVGMHLGIDLQDIMKKRGAGKSSDFAVSNKMGTSCYTYQAFPLGVYVARSHTRKVLDTETVRAALLANVNIGGENCFRSSLMGAILGAAGGMKVLPEDLLQGLTGKHEIKAAVDGLLSVLQSHVTSKKEL